MKPFFLTPTPQEHFLITCLLENQPPKVQSIMGLTMTVHTKLLMVFIGDVTGFMIMATQSKLRKSRPILGGMEILEKNTKSP